MQATIGATMPRSKGRTGRPWRRLTRRLRRQHRPCHICGQPIDYTLPPQHPQSFTADHLLPLALDTDDRHARRFDNLDAAHRACNSSRGTGSKPKLENSKNW